MIGGIAEDDEDDRDFGIFIKKVLFGGVAALDGKINRCTLKVNMVHIVKQRNVVLSNARP